MNKLLCLVIVLLASEMILAGKKKGKSDGDDGGSDDGGSDGEEESDEKDDEGDTNQGADQGNENDATSTTNVKNTNTQTINIDREE